MFAWGDEDGRIPTNPARDAKKIKYATDGWHTWTVDELRRYIDRHPIGTKAYLALALLMFTGARRSDVVKLGRQHVKAGWVRFVATKTRKVRAAAHEIPVLDALKDALDAGPTGSLPSSRPSSDAPSVQPGSGLGSGPGASKPICPIARRINSARPAPRSPRRTAPPIDS